MNKTVVTIVVVIVVGFIGLFVLSSSTSPKKSQEIKLEEEEQLSNDLSVTGGVNRSATKDGVDNADLNKANVNDSTVYPFGQGAAQQGQVQGQQTQQAQQQQAQQQQQQGQSLPPLPGGKKILMAKKATIQTSKGNIVIELNSSVAPNTVNNFSNKANDNFYDNLTFHRVEGWVIQGGDPLGNGTGGTNNLPTEISSESFVAGSVGVARGGDPKISNDAQFFITKTDSPHLNGQYTYFGKVIEGMDIVGQIAIGDKITDILLEM